MLRKRVVSLVILTLIASAVVSNDLSGQIPPCTTPSNYVYCTSCPAGRVNNCYDSSQWSYTVFGTVEEVWCNIGPGWCDAYWCDTNSSIATARDCNGSLGSFMGTICCIMI